LCYARRRSQKPDARSHQRENCFVSCLKVGSLGDDTCCADAWGGPDEAHIINEDLPAIQRAVAKELGLATIPFREAIGECLRINQSLTSPARDTG
jgi:hypothetical protein